MLRGGRRSAAEIIKKPDDNAIRVKYRLYLQTAHLSKTVLDTF